MEHWHLRTFYPKQFGPEGMLGKPMTDKVLTEVEAKAYPRLRENQRLQKCNGKRCK